MKGIDVLGVGFGTLLGALGSAQLIAAPQGRGSVPIGLGLVSIGAVVAYVAAQQGAGRI